jgi:hypothetical protein
MWDGDWNALMSFIRSRYTNSLEKKLNITYFSPDINDYKTGDFYVPDFEPNLDMIDTARNRIFYLSTTLEFIEY